MRAIINSTWVGLISGIFLPMVVIIFFYFFQDQDFEIVQLFRFLVEQEVFTKVLSLCIIPNLFIFFIFIWLNMLNAARGVLVSTFIYAFVIVILKFIV